MIPPSLEDIKIIFSIVPNIPNTKVEKISEVCVFANRVCGIFLRKISERIYKANHSDYKYVVVDTGCELKDEKTFMEQGVAVDRSKIYAMLR